MFVVYALIDPRDNTIHYVGITDDVYRRFFDHVSCGGNNLVKNLWLLELRQANKMVIMETLEEVETREQALKREAYWIKHFETLEEPIANINKTASARRSKKMGLKYGRKLAKQIPVEPPAQVVRAKISHDPTEEDKQRIKALVQSGMPRRQICKALGKGNGYYNTVRQVLDEEGL